MHFLHRTCRPCGRFHEKQKVGSPKAVVGSWPAPRCGVAAAFGECLRIRNIVRIEISVEPIEPERAVQKYAAFWRSTLGGRRSTTRELATL